MVTNQRMEKFLELEEFEELSAGWLGLKTKKEYEEYERKRRRLTVMKDQDEEMGDKSERSDKAPSDTEEGERSQDGWQGNTSDEDEFCALTQRYVEDTTNHPRLVTNQEESKPDHAPSVQGGKVQAPSVQGEQELVEVTLVEETAYHAPSEQGMTDHAPSVQAEMTGLKLSPEERSEGDILSGSTEETGLANYSSYFIIYK